MSPARLDLLAQVTPPGHEFNVFALVLQASPVVQLVIVLLVGLSVASWAVIFLKSRSFRRAAQESEDIWQEIETGHPGLADLRDLVEDYTDAPEASLLRAGFDEWTRLGGPTASPGHLRLVRNALDRAAGREVLLLERHLTLLATTGSASPFIGLFGTVWGIMNTFRSLGFSGSTSLAVVAPGIAEALIATAVGLAAAIPAVMAYNTFLQKIRIMQSKMDNFISQFMDILPADAAAQEADLVAHDISRPGR